MPMALGLIESIGLTAAVEADDAAVKAASIELIGMESTKGSGRIVVKFQGDVGAVKAAAEAGAKAAAAVGEVCSCRVIPRPAEGIRKLFLKNESLSYEQKETNGNREETQITCNLCMDPKCGRKRGEPHVNCIHYSDEKINDQKDMKGEHHE